MDLEPGLHEIEVSADGYETTRDWVEIAAGQVQHLERSNLPGSRLASG